MRTRPTAVKLARAPLVVLAFAVVSAPARRPTLLYVLASTGLLLGGLGSFYSGCHAAPLLQSRDQYLAAIHDVAEHQALPPEVGSKEDLMKAFDKQAEVVYSRRGVALPLDAMNFILSMLLFLGCGRALRGHTWGLQAWILAAMVSVPYTLLDCAFSIVQSRDLQNAYRDTSGMLGVVMMASTRLQILIAMVKSGVEILFFGICVIYLRRPNVRKLFTDDAARS